MRVTDEMVERALKATPLVDGDKFAPALQGLFVQRRRTILREALEAALADAPEPVDTGNWLALLKKTCARLEAAEAKLAKVRAWRDQQRRRGFGHPHLNAILDEAP